jgi:outer membrane biosynthesis protein TonB
MNPKTVQLLCVGAALALCSIALASLPSKGPEYSAWQKKVLDEIGERWYRQVSTDSGMIKVGAVRISFRVMADGHIKNLRIISNTSNEAFANICIHAVQEARIPPIPKSILRPKPEQWIDFEIPFTIFAK